MAETRTSDTKTENVREVKRPGGRGRAMGPRPKLDDPMGLFKRLMGYVFKQYRIHFMIVVICIIVSVLARSI